MLTKYLKRMNNEKPQRALEKCWNPLHHHEKGENDMRVSGYGFFLNPKAYYAYLNF
jgi:hypothetical protein